MLERNYQVKLIRRLRSMFKGCYILKNDTAYLQGVPDLLILYKDKWAMLEVKADCNAVVQPNQNYYIQDLDRLSFAAFICPENEEEVLRDLQQAFGTRGASRVPQR